MNIAAMIDHTLLKPDATPDQIVRLCDEAMTYRFASVCVNSGYVALAHRQLKDSAVKVCSVVGFPLGAMETEAKAYETRRAIELGAEEIDMVIPIGLMKAGRLDAVRRDIERVREASRGVVLKVIFETAMLTDEEIVTLCTLCTEIGVDFVKTSTGFGGGGATPETVALMKRSVGEGVQVKASGGIRDYPTARMMIEAGATRLGVSAGVAIAEQAGANQTPPSDTAASSDSTDEAY
jgi:deoxyribose-phosphate aldolase